jgi:hypothetical protein
LLVLAGCAVRGAPEPSPTLSSSSGSSAALEPAASSVVPPADRAQVERIAAEALARGRAYAMLAELCRVAPKRLAGSRGAQDAVDWAARTMRACGLENVRLEPCVVPHWERGAPERLVLTAPSEVAGVELPALALGDSIGTSAAGIEAEIVAVRSFEELSALGDGALGKIVLFARAMDDAALEPFSAYGGAVDQRSRGASEAARAGAVAALVRSMTTLQDDLPHTGGLRYEDGVARVPAAAVSTNACDRIVALLAQSERVRARLTTHCRTLSDEPSYNVVGELVGRELPDEIVLVGGHLDAWDAGSGAHDDGAGCAHSIEALRLLRVLDLRPRRTLRCVLFMNEENGLRGARAYAEAHADELARHVFALESDRGGFTPRGFSTNAGPEALALLRALAAPLECLGAERVSAGGGGADISVLARGGVPLCGFVPDPQRYFDVHHCARDTIEAVNRRELELGAAAVAALLYQVAELEPPLPRNEPREAVPRGR